MGRRGAQQSLRRSILLRPREEGREARLCGVVDCFIFLEDDRPLHYLLYVEQSALVADLRQRIEDGDDQRSVRRPQPLVERLEMCGLEHWRVAMAQLWQQPLE